MSRSRPPRCPNGSNCGVCHPGKPEEPARDRRKEDLDEEYIWPEWTEDDITDQDDNHPTQKSQAQV